MSFTIGLIESAISNVVIFFNRNFYVMLKFVGSLPVWLIVLSLCFISWIMSATTYLINYYTMLYGCE